MSIVHNLSRPTMFALRLLPRLRVTVATPTSTRAFSIFNNTLRPSILPTATSTISSTPTISEIGGLDLVPRISSSPILRALQVRNGPRDNFNRASHFVRKRRAGFLARIRTRTGRAILKRRRLKGRKNLTH